MRGRASIVCATGNCPAVPPSTQLQITTNSLQGGAVNQSYSAQLAATGGSRSYTWTVVSGSLPSGLSLGSSGLISGTPSAAGSPVSFTVQVVDTSTPQQHDEATLSLPIAAQPEGASSGALYGFSIQVSGGGAEGYDAVGNVTAYSDSVNGAWTFSYDTLNRLATAAGSQDYNPYPNLCWSYDNFGNRTAQTASATAYTNSNGGANTCPAGSGPSYIETYNASNQFSGGLQTYDGAGNIQADSATGNLYLYDGEGRLCAMEQKIAGVTAMTQYLYDAEGHRVAKGSITTFNCNAASNGFTAAAVYVLGPGGEQLTEMANISSTQTPSWQWAHTNVYAAGQLAATYDADLSGQTEGRLYFHLSDWLGTRRQQTDYAANPVLNFTGLPYGDGISTIPVSANDTADATEHHFTGKERDSESGNDYFGARYHASTMGRFLSPDPLFISPERLADPQSLNLYSYVRNNPLGLTDDTGLDFYLACQTSDNSSCGQVQNGSNSVWVQG